MLKKEQERKIKIEVYMNGEPSFFVLATEQEIKCCIRHFCSPLNQAGGEAVQIYMYGANDFLEVRGTPFVEIECQPGYGFADLFPGRWEGDCIILDCSRCPRGIKMKTIEQIAAELIGMDLQDGDEAFGGYEFEGVSEIIWSDQNDGTYQVYANHADAPIIKIVVEDGIITEAWVA